MFILSKEQVHILRNLTKESYEDPLRQVIVIKTLKDVEFHIPLLQLMNLDFDELVRLIKFHDAENEK